MTDFPPQRDDERFQEVLGRLDALVKRGQPEEDPPPPPAISEATIPVLTDVYRPAEESSDQSPIAKYNEEDIEHAIAGVLPQMTSMLEEAVLERLKPALSEALDAAMAELRPRIEESIRQHLQQALAQNKD